MTAVARFGMGAFFSFAFSSYSIMDVSQPQCTSFFSAIMSNIWLRANQRKTRTQNHQNLTTVLLRLSKYWQILHRSATTSLQNAARNVKAENRRETAQSSWVCQVYRRDYFSKNRRRVT